MATVDADPSDGEKLEALTGLVIAIVEKATRGYRVTDCCLLCYATPAHAADCPIPAAAAVVGYVGTPLPKGPDA